MNAPVAWYPRCPAHPCLIFKRGVIGKLVTATLPDAAAARSSAEVHAQLVALGESRAAHEREVCRWLLAAERLTVHIHAGYASFSPGCGVSPQESTPSERWA